jgi:hypothetical protein
LTRGSIGGLTRLSGYSTGRLARRTADAADCTADAAQLGVGKSRR